MRSTRWWLDGKSSACKSGKVRGFRNIQSGGYMKTAFTLIKRPVPHAAMNEEYLRENVISKKKPGTLRYPAS